MTKRRSILLVTWAILMALPGFVFADEGPVVIANREKHPYLSLDPFHGSIGVTGLYATQRTNSAAASDTLFTQDFTLGTSGAIVSNNLATWTASGTLSLQEEWTTGDGTKDFQFGVFDAYDLQLNALNSTQYPFSIYARRNESFLNRAFAALLRDTTSAYGASFHYNNPVLPTTLNISHTSTDQSTLAGETQFNIEQTDIELSSSFQPWDRHNISLNSHYAAIDQNNPGLISNSSTLEGFNVTHNWSIDPAAHYTLTQTLDYSQQAGNFPYTQLRIGEQLHMRHSDTLYSDLHYAYEQHDYAASSNSRHSFNGTITHRLYESLVTTGRAGATFSQNSYAANGLNASATNTNFFADVNLDYRKKLWLGELGANLGLGYSQSDSGSVGITQQVNGEVQSFTDPRPIVLTRPGVNAGSIAVFNASGSRQYVQNIDYTIRTVGNTVQIDRITGGNINPGDTIRLNYDIDPLPGYTSATTNLTTGINYAFYEGLFNGLNLYARYFQSDQSITPASSGIRPDSVRETVFGAEYRVWKLTLRAEDVHHDSTLSPFDALRFTARYDDRLGDRTTLTIDLTQNYIQYPLDHSQTVLTTVDGRLQYQINRDLRAILSARWRNDDDSLIGQTSGIEEQLELHWKIRQTDVFGLIRHTNLDNPDHDSSTFFLQFGVTRNF